MPTELTPLAEIEPELLTVRSPVLASMPMPELNRLIVPIEPELLIVLPPPTRMPVGAPVTSKPVTDATGCTLIVSPVWVPSPYPVLAAGP